MKKTPLEQAKKCRSNSRALQLQTDVILKTDYQRDSRNDELLTRPIQSFKVQLMNSNRIRIRLIY